MPSPRAMMRGTRPKFIDAECQYAKLGKSEGLVLATSFFNVFNRNVRAECKNIEFF
jgi:hypothetical protein